MAMLKTIARAAEVMGGNAASDTRDTKIVYVALWALPGCLPEMEPVRCASFGEAKMFICEEVERMIEQAYTADEDDTAREWHRLLNDIRGYATDAPFSRLAPDGYIYEITTDVMQDGDGDWDDSLMEPVS